MNVAYNDKTCRRHRRTHCIALVETDLEDNYFWYHTLLSTHYSLFLVISCGFPMQWLCYKLLQLYDVN